MLTVLKRLFWKIYPVAAIIAFLAALVIYSIDAAGPQEIPDQEATSSLTQ